MLSGDPVHTGTRLRQFMLITFVSTSARLLIAFLAIAVFPMNSLAALPESGTERAAIPVEDILFRFSDEQQRVAQARQLLTQTGKLQALQSALSEIAASVDAKRDTGSRSALHGLPVMRLESLARHYDFDARRLQDWEAQARLTFEPYDETAAQLAHQRAAWTATRASGLAVQLPPVLYTRIDAALAQIDSVESGFEQVLKTQSALAQEASEVRGRIAAGSSHVAAAIGQVDKRLFHIDAPPLWRDSILSGSTGQVWESVERGLQIERQFAVDYHAAWTGNQQVLRIVQLSLLPLLLWLSARGSKTARQPGTAVTHLLHRPISTWILLSMLSVLVLEPDAPLLVQEFALVAAVIPVLRLLPARIAYGRWTYAAIALYALDRASVAAIADSAVYRWLLLVLTILALVVAWRIHAGSRRAARGRLAAILRLVNMAALAALTIALLSNVAGNATLAETLTSGVIDSAYMAILLYAGMVSGHNIARALVSRWSHTSSRFVLRHSAELQAAFSRIVVLSASAGWLIYTLDTFRALRPLREVVGAVMRAGLQIGELSADVGQALTLLVASWLAFWTARLVRRVLREELPGHPGLARGVGSSIASLSYYSVLVLGLLFALSAAGVKLGQLAIVFGALGVGIGFGLQNVVNNFVSGLVLMFERPIQPGDTVDAAGVSGTVREIRLRSTTIRTFDGADTVIPNGVLLNGSLTNWTMYDRSRRFEIALGVDSDADPAQVLGILTSVVQETKGVASSTAPMVMLVGYAQNALNFAISIWVDDAGDWFTVRGDMLARILPALRAAGVGNPCSQVEVHLHHAPVTEAIEPRPER